MRNLMRNVSHKLCWAPLSTVNFARKPRNPVGTTGGTVASATSVVLIASPTAPRSKLKHVRKKLPRIEHREIVKSFSRANEARWDSEFILDRDNDAASAAAIEFCDNYASEREGTVEFAGLAEGITASGCVHHEQCLVRRVGIELGERAFHFLKLSHQIRFGVLAASRIAKQKVDLARCRRLICFVTKRGWIGAVLAANHFKSESFGPNIKLLYRRSAKGVGCG